MYSTEWIAGENPLTLENPWEFTEDGRFTTLRDYHHGRWDLKINTLYENL